jgi:hypothetical protein
MKAAYNFGHTGLQKSYSPDMRAADNADRLDYNVHAVRMLTQRITWTYGAIGPTVRMCMQRICGHMGPQRSHRPDVHAVWRPCLQQWTVPFIYVGKGGAADLK